MTTEQHAWFSGNTSTTAVLTRPTTTPVCGCGQDLDICARRHCPRCGSLIHA